MNRKQKLTISIIVTGILFIMAFLYFIVSDAYIAEAEQARHNYIFTQSEYMEPIYLREYKHALYKVAEFESYSILSFVGGLIGLVATAVIAVICKPEEKKEETGERRCPNCGRVIPFDARTCPYCSKKFENNIPMNDNVKTEKFVEEIEKAKEEAEWDEVETSQEEKKIKICPSCGYENKLTSNFCKKCGTKLGE